MRVSFCLIARNEEACLAACLRSAIDLVFEVIVVDAGSTDRTKEIAASLGAKVIECPWADSFAAARNESIRHATGDWVYWLDGDECLDDENRARVHKLFSELRDENVAYTMCQRSELEASTQSAAMVQHVRLFRNHPKIRWQYRVHEQILPSIRAAGGELRHTDIIINHVGFRDPALQDGKVERNLRLLLMEVLERPDDPFVLFNLAAVYVGRGQCRQALPLLQRSLALSHPQDTITPKLHALTVRSHHHLGQPREALTACGTGRAQFPEDAELLFWEAMLLKEQREPAGAERGLRQLLELPRRAHFTGADVGMQSYKARHYLAEVCREQGRADEAEDLWRRVLAERADFAPTLLGMAQLYCEQGRWAELDEVLPRLEENPQAAGDVAVLRARRQLARDRPSAARRTLEAVLPHAPQALRPRVLLSHALLQEGQDWDAAEDALRAVLRLAPREGESWRNLATLLRQQGRLAEAFAACRAGQFHCPDYHELFALEGFVLQDRGDHAGAEAAFLRFLEKESHTPQPGPHARQLRQSARRQLGLHYRQTGRHAEAEAQLQVLLAEEPDCGPAWLELGELYLTQQRWADLEDVACRLERDPRGAVEAGVLRARAHLARGEYEPCRRLAQALTTQVPQDVRPRLALCYAYLQEGSDWPAAEQALLQVLALDPQHAETQRNLAAVRQRLGHTAGA